MSQTNSLDNKIINLVNEIEKHLQISQKLDIYEYREYDNITANTSLVELEITRYRTSTKLSVKRVGYEKYKQDFFVTSKDVIKRIDFLYEYLKDMYKSNRVSMSKESWELLEGISIINSPMMENLND